MTPELPKLVINQVLAPDYNTIAIIAGEESILEVLASLGQFSPKLPEATIFHHEAYNANYHFFLDEQLRK